MDETTPKEKIFKRIREALITPLESPYPNLDLEGSIMPDTNEYLDILFAENFVRMGGKFVYCESVSVAIQSLHVLGLQENWSNNIYCRDETIGTLLHSAGLSYGNSPKDAVVKKVGCCACKYLLARTGSMVFDSSQVGRKIFASAEVLLFFATMRELVPDMKTALKQIKESRQPFPSMLSTWTGLSKITDIDMDEKNGLGPDKIFLFLIDEFETKE